MVEWFLVRHCTNSPNIVLTWEALPRGRMISSPTMACTLFRQITIFDVTPHCKDIPFDLARLEGEDDSLESWRKNHEVFFREEGKELGYAFSEEMPVIFEEFEVVETL